MNEELDIVVFEDEDGQEIEYEILFAFEHKDDDYAVLQRYIADEAAAAEVSDEELEDVYILKIVGEGDDEELVPVEEELLEELTAVVGTILEEEFGDLMEEAEAEE
ncbi:DUF1292 domain-containing protein [Eubacteriales bacterium OttesenSCG-928-M02]|nr:DUF1292 domain-containing protein [Eubacteriales bacterium OttesenSCG-928-M02]